VVIGPGGGGQGGWISGLMDEWMGKNGVVE